MTSFMDIYASYIFIYIFVIHFSVSNCSYLYSIRGGRVAVAKSGNIKDYYNSFELDYGRDINEYNAGNVDIILKNPKDSICSSLSLSSWLNKDIFGRNEKEVSGRIKPFYAIDFGTRSDLKKGENPMIIIVQRNLQYDSNGYLISPSTTIDIEKRTIWQPWYKRRCNFAVRYIIPNREGILNIMKSKNRISHKICYDDNNSNSPINSNTNNNYKNKKLISNIVFKPSLYDKYIRNKQPVTIRREIPSVFADTNQDRKWGWRNTIKDMITRRSFIPPVILDRSKEISEKYLTETRKQYISNAMDYYHIASAIKEMIDDYLQIQRENENSNAQWQGLGKRSVKESSDDDMTWIERLSRMVDEIVED